MKNDKLIEIDGMKVLVSQVKHWRYSHDAFMPMQNREAHFKWLALQNIAYAWVKLDAGLILSCLNDVFSYGSYWVKGKEMSLAEYRDYLPQKFATIRRSGSRLKIDIVVLYEGLVPEEFPYAMRIIQGDHACLLTLKFNGDKVSSMYMTDPDIYTYEPTFVKGGIMSNEGDPRIFEHVCAETDKGRMMSAVELQAFAVECVANLFREVGAEIVGVHKSAYKEFPNLITKCGPDIFYHRLDVVGHGQDGFVSDEDRDEFLSTARSNGAYPMVMPVSFWNANDDPEKAVCGGQYFLKVHESRIVESIES